MIHLSVTQSDTKYPHDRPQRWHLTLATGNHTVALAGEPNTNKGDLVGLAEALADPDQEVVLHVDGEEDRVLRPSTQKRT